MVDLEDVFPYLREADALCVVGDYTETEKIYASLFTPELVTAHPMCRATK